MKTKALTALLVLFFTPSVLFAARPSITGLQQQINELNAKLNTVEAELHNKKTLFLKSNGDNVGVVIEIKDTIIFQLNRGVYHALSLQEYLFAVNIETGELEPILGTTVFYYLDIACSGDPYIRIISPGVYRPGDPLPVDAQGRVFPTPLFDDTTLAYYVAKGTVAVELSPVSRRFLQPNSGQPDRCEETTDIQPSAYFPVLPNTKETGVPQPPLATPITIGY